MSLAAPGRDENKSFKFLLLLDKYIENRINLANNPTF
jgi:hypothetical protein